MANLTAKGLSEDLEFAVFARRMQRLTGLDLSGYKREQLRRRLGAIMARAGAHDLLELAALLDREPSRAEAVRDALTINVSEFFRDVDRFRCLETLILPEIISRNRRPVIWSAGCSNGSEPYSLAMIMSDLMPRGGYRIVASDIDQGILTQARAGDCYPATTVRNVSSARLAKYFRQTNGTFAVAESIKRKVEFRRCNLLSDPFDLDFDLIVCRNVVIYFTDQAKSVLFKRFASSLADQGVLFIGATEMIPGEQADYFKLVETGFYRRTAVEEDSTYGNSRKNQREVGWRSDSHTSADRA